MGLASPSVCNTVINQEKPLTLHGSGRLGLSTERMGENLNLTKSFFVGSYLSHRLLIRKKNHWGAGGVGSREVWLITTLFTSFFLNLP